MRAGTRVRVIGSDALPADVGDAPEFVGTVTRSYTRASEKWLDVAWDDGTNEPFPLDEVTVLP